MIDIEAARNDFKDKVIHDIGFVRSAENIADGLTKEMQQASLRNVMLTGKLECNPVQWIIRPVDPTVKTKKVNPSKGSDVPSASSVTNYEQGADFSFDAHNQHLGSEAKLRVTHTACL